MIKRRALLIWFVLMMIANTAFATILEHGHEGEAVIALQQILKDIGHHHGEVDGIFGYETQSAIKLIQEQCGLEVTGALDADTHKILQEEPHRAQATVHIAPKGERYHRHEGCRGLSNAESVTPVGFVTIRDDRTPCKWCYGDLPENSD